MGNLFSKFVIKGKKSDFFHSSGYGVAQNGSNMGVETAQSFEARMKIEQNRQKIQKYNDSRLVMQGGNCQPKASTYGGRIGDSGNGLVGGTRNAGTGNVKEVGNARVSGGSSIGTKSASRVGLNGDTKMNGGSGVGFGGGARPGGSARVMSGVKIRGK